MRHRKAGVKLNMTSSHKQAMFRNMVTSLFKHERIRTTDAKAKELRRLADHMVTLAKRGDLHARRQAMAVIREKDVVHKLFEEAADRFGAVSGGYTRVVKLGRRPGDAAPISLIELIAAEGREKKKKATKKAKSAAPKKTAKKTEEAIEEKAAVEAAEAQPETGDAEAQEAPIKETVATETPPEGQVDAGEEKKAKAQAEDAPAVEEPPPAETEAEDSGEKKNN